MTQRLAYPTTAFLMALVLVPVAIMLAASTAHASHGDEGTSRYSWDRSTASGHRNLLICDRYPNDDRCDIPFMIHRNAANIGLPIYTIDSETDLAKNTVNSVTDYIGVRKTSSSDNVLSSKVMYHMTVGEYDIDRHCIGVFGICLTKDHARDNHIVKFAIYLNSNSMVDFGTIEWCIKKMPIKYDVEKTIAHELWHIMGSEHSAERTSIVNYNGYLCGMGETPNTHDRAVLKAKYPGGIR